MIKINNHLIQGADYQESPNKSGTINPRFIVQHYTAGYTAQDAINTLTRPGSNVSAHVVISLDGTITQLVPFNIKAWHAGPSNYMGYTGLNSHSIGIEIVNIGWLRRVSDDRYQDSYGNTRYERDFPHGMIASPHPRVGSGMFYWPCYTPEQLHAVNNLTEALVQSYSILDVVSHEEIDSRGWKTDPGPAFPMKLVKSHIDSDRGNESESFVVTASSLNVRGGPGIRFSVIDKLLRNNAVDVRERRGSWARISDDGWVHSDYLRRA